jgi:uncharacterized DUF497 family protein
VPDEVPGWTWDPEKARSNWRKHGVSFADAVTALEDPLAWIPLERGGRIVSARKATPRERRSYEEKS